MNVLVNNSRCLICNVASKAYNPARGYAFKSDLKIKWVRPEKIPCIKPEKSGDLGLDLKIDPKQTPGIYAKSEELKDADEIVKKMFTLEFLPRKETVAARRDSTQALVRRHAADQESMESKIAGMTSQIHQLQEYMDKFPRDLRTKVFLKELIDRRKKYLKFLRIEDYKCFEWILEKLNLVYKPPPPHFHWITRKDSLRKLTDKHCEKIKEDRLEAYKAELAAQHKDFYTDKVKKLEFIRAEELACGVTPTVSEEDIENAKKKLSELK